MRRTPTAARPVVVAAEGQGALPQAEVTGGVMAAALGQPGDGRRVTPAKGQADPDEAVVVEPARRADRVTAVAVGTHEFSVAPGRFPRAASDSDGDERAGGAGARTFSRVERSEQLLGGTRVSVVIPTLNEAKNLSHVFERLPAGLHEVIVVDGHSTDETVEVAQRLRPDVRVMTQTGRGKGNALKTGFEACTGDIIVMVDADGSTDPAEIPRFAAALQNGADFVKGSRFAQGGASLDITRTRRIGNRGLNLLVNALYGTSYTDLCYGYNAFWRRCLRYMRIDCDGFEVETLINVRVAKAGLVIHEVPSFESHRLHGASNLRAVRDGVRVLRTIALERYPRLWRGVGLASRLRLS